MRQRRGVVEEERLLFILPDESKGGVQQPRCVRPVGFLPRIPDTLQVPVKPRAFFKIDHEAVEEIEAVPHRVECIPFTQMPLADNPSGIAGLPEQLRRGDFVSMNPDPVSVVDHLSATGTVRVRTRHERQTRRRTPLMHIEVCELHTLLAQPVDVRRLKRIRTETTEVAVTLIVSQEDNDVRFVGSLDRSCDKNQRADAEDGTFEGSSHYPGNHWPSCSGVSSSRYAFNSLTA